MFRDHGVEVVAISTDGVGDASKMASLIQAQFPVLADHDKSVAREYGVYNLLGDGAAAPATIVIGNNGIVKWSHVGRTISDRPAPEEVIERIEALER